MIKYFIENSQGEWLASPDHYVGTGWTRNPDKALTFDDLVTNTGLDMNFMKAQSITFFLLSETGIYHKVKEHEFIPLTNVGHPVSRGKDVIMRCTVTSEMYLDSEDGELWQMTASFEGASGTGYQYKLAP